MPVTVKEYVDKDKRTVSLEQAIFKQGLGLSLTISIPTAKNA